MQISYSKKVRKYFTVSFQPRIMNGSIKDNLLKVSENFIRKKEKSFIW